MPNDDLNLDSGLVAPQQAKPTTSHLDQLLEFAKKFNLTMGSTTGGTHNRGSLHYSGNAFDVKNSGGFDNARVTALKQAASEFGLLVRDERIRPKGQEVWGGPHIHIEKAGGDDPLNLDAGLTVENLDAGYADTPTRPTSAASSRSAYNSAGRAAVNAPSPLDKLARDIEWHFGYGTLASFDKLKPEQQQQIAQLATQYAAEDEVKKKQGIQLEPSPAWKLANQRKVGAVEGVDFEVRNRPDVVAKMDADWRNSTALQKAAKENVFGFTLDPITNIRHLVGAAWGGSKYFSNEVAKEEESLRAQQARSQTPEMQSIRKEYGRMSATTRSVAAPTISAGGDMLKLVGGITSLAGIAPNRLSDWANKRGQIVQEAAASTPLTEMGDEIQRQLPEKVVSALAQTGLSIAEIVLLKKATGMPLGRLLALETALKTSDQPLEKRASQVAESYIMGRVLERHLSRPASALLFGAPTAVREGHAYLRGDTSVEDAILQTGVQTGVGLALGGGKTEKGAEQPSLTDFDPLRETIPEELQAKLQAADTAKFEESRAAATERLTRERNAELKKSTPLGTIAPEVKLPERPITRSVPSSREVPSTNYRVPLSEHAPTMYREASPSKALELLPTSRISTDTPDVYLADNPDLALGQGGNKGVMLEFDASKLQGQINQKPGWQITYQNGAAEYRATYNKQSQFQDALTSVTIRPDAKMTRAERMQMDRALGEIEQQGWTKTQENGNTVYRKPTVASDDALLDSLVEKKSSAVSPSVREGEKDFTYFKSQGLSNVEAATRAAHEKVFQASRNYYQERLANPELLERAIPLTSPEGNLFAVPVGGSRKTGASEVLYSKPEGERLLQEIKDKPGFENARLRLVSGKFSLEWGGPEAGYRSESNPTEKIGRAYGYSEKAIADFIRDKHSPSLQVVPETKGAVTLKHTPLEQMGELYYNKVAQSVRAYDSDGKEIGRVVFTEGGYPLEVFVEPEFRRQRIATKLYDEAEKILGRPLQLGSQNEAGAAFRESRGQKERSQPSLPPQVEVGKGVKLPEPPKFAGQEGSATLDAISGGALGKLNKLRQTAVTMVQRSGVAAYIKAGRDAVDTKADNFAVNVSNDVAQPLERLVGRKDLRLAQDALTPLVESKVKSFTEQRDVINNTPNAPAGWRKRMLAAIDYAEANQVRLQPTADEYSRILEEQRLYENSNGIPTAKFEGYVPRRVDYESGEDIGFLDGGGGDGTGKPFIKVRVHQTMADLIASGQNPKSIDAVGLMTDRIARGQRAVNQRLWTTDLKSTIDPKTNTPVATEMVTVTRADGTTIQAAPAGYTPVDGLAIRKGYQSIYKDLVNPNWLSDSMLWRGYRASNSFGKSLILAIDTYHLGRMALAESVLKGVGGVIPGETVRKPLPSYQRGLSILDFSEKEIAQRVKLGEYSPEYAQGLLNSKRIAQLYLDGGLNIGKIADNFHNTLVHSIPVLRNINHFIFNSFQRGAMMEVAELEYYRLKRARPEMSDVEIVSKTKDDLNATFGSLGRQGVFTSQWAQDVARGIFLAPQWREGLIRRELGAAKQLGEFALDSAKGKRPYLGGRLRLVGSTAVGIFIGNQIINLATRGYPTWQNPEDEWGSKISAWIPDYFGKSNGFFLNPVGIAMETFHAVSSYFNKADGSTEEKTYSAGGKYARTGLSYGVRPWTQLITGRDDMGRLITPENRRSQFEWEFLPSPIQSGALTDAVKQVVSGKDEQQYPGQYQSQMMASMLGLKTERVLADEQQIRRRARLFNQARGIASQGEFYEGPYMALTRTLGSEGDLGTLNELIAHHMTNEFTSFSEAKEKVRDYYEKRVDAPLTGNKERERAFLKTLNPEQLAQYNASMELRRHDRDAVRELLKRVSAPASAQ